MKQSYTYISQNASSNKKNIYSALVWEATYASFYLTIM